MSLLRKELATFGKRPIDWTGILQRMVREAAEDIQVELSEIELDNLLSLPARIADLVQSGVLVALELRAGKGGCSIGFPSDPDAPDDLDLSALRLCDLRARELRVELVVNDEALARMLGAGALASLSSERLRVSFRPEAPRVPPPRGPRRRQLNPESEACP